MGSVQPLNVHVWYRIATFKFYRQQLDHNIFFLHLNGVFLVRSGREGNKKALRNNLEIKKKLKQFWIIFFEKSQPPPFPVKWSVPNKSVTTTKQDISHTTLETQNQQVYPQNKEIYCNTSGMVYLVNSGVYYTYRIF